MIRMLFMLMLCLFFISSTSVAQARNLEALPDPEQEKLARSIMLEIRCLQCQNQSIVDSDADLALDLRRLVRMKVAEGLLRQQIKDMLVEDYGEWILLQPPVKPATYLLWGSPMILMLLIVLFIILRRRDNQPQERGTLSAEEEEALAAILADTQQKLRQEDETEQKSEAQQ